MADWPKADERKINERLERQEREVEQLSEDINNILRIVKSKRQKPKKAYVYVIPNQKSVYENNLDLIKKKTSLAVEVFAVNDKDKYDPKGISKKSKPGRPGIYIE